MGSLKKSDLKVALCPWCKHNGFACGEKEFEKCDFKSLEMEKHAILERMEAEVQEIEFVKSNIKKGNVDRLGELIDRSTGVGIMMKVLEDQFGVSRDESMKASGMKELSFVEKAKLAGKLAVFQAKRKSK